MIEADHWQIAHTAHGRAITPVVVLTYGALVTACLWSILEMPSSPGVWVALVGAAFAMGSTALVAAPTHGALSTGPTPHLLRRLLIADRVRLVGAALAMVGAVSVAV